jgi:hypothetical protein
MPLGGAVSYSLRASIAGIALLASALGSGGAQAKLPPIYPVKALPMK